jgi:hypothetical protein
MNMEFKPTLSDDASCIEHCNAQKGSRRFKKACIQRCTGSSKYGSTDIRHPNTSIDIVTQLGGIQSADGLSPIKVDLQDEKRTNEFTTPLSLQDNSTGTEPSSSAQIEVQKLLETDFEAETVRINVSDAALNSTREVSSDPNSNSTGSTMTAAHLMNEATKNEPQNSDHGNVTVVLNTTETKIDVASETKAQNETSPKDTTSAPTSDKDVSSKTTSFDVPSWAPAAAPTVMSQNSTLSIDLDSEHDSVAEHDSAILDFNRECIDKCNGKRTLKRKRDACLKLCSSSAPSLKQEYASSKFEL